MVSKTHLCWIFDFWSHLVRGWSYQGCFFCWPWISSLSFHKPPIFTCVSCFLLVRVAFSRVWRNTFYLTWSWALWWQPFWKHSQDVIHNDSSQKDINERCNSISRTGEWESRRERIVSANNGYVAKHWLDLNDIDYIQINRSPHQSHITKSSNNNSASLVQNVASQ